MTTQPDALLYRGTPVEQLTREELIAALKEAVRTMYDMRESAAKRHELFVRRRR